MRHVAWLVLALEAAIRVLWRPVSWTLFFAILWLLQIPAMLGAAVGILTLLIFIIGFAILVRYGLKTERRPDADAVDRRLERGSAVPHRPLAHLGDNLANAGGASAQFLWQRRREQALEAVQNLRAPRPQAQIAGRDPAALRIGILLLLLIALTAAGPQWRPRLAQGLFPFTASLAADVAPDDDLLVWITPPAYTHQPRLTLQGEGHLDKPVSIPEGSVIKARLRGGFGHPSLIMGATRLPMTRMDEKDAHAWGIETKILPGDGLRIHQGFRTRWRVPMVYVADHPPAIALKNAPVVLPKGGLQFDVTVRDDYGVTSLLLSLKPDPAVALPSMGAKQTLVRSVMSLPGKDTELKPVFDLTGHPWAGLPVILEIAAKDGAGHVTAAPPIHITLPERSFNNPAAQQVAALRKQLIQMPRDGLRVAEALENLMVHIGLYNGDFITFLSLRSAASHLIWDRSGAAPAAVIGQLWQTALRIEDGNLSLTAQSLRDAQGDVQKLLDDPHATPVQMAAAMERLRAAMGQYLNQLYRTVLEQMARNGQDLSKMTPDAFKRQINADQLAAFLDQMQAKAVSGDRDAARQMLAQLQGLSDKIDPAAAGSEMSPRMQAMMKTLQGLNALIAGQKTLRDQTAQAQKDGKPTNGQRPLQEDLRRRLGEIMRGLDGTSNPSPPPLQKAEQSMRDASAALQEDKGEAATKAQQATLDQLSQATQGMQQQLQQAVKEMMAMGTGPTDPLGRPLENGTPSLLPQSDIKIPDQAERRQVQDILKILRDRSGDYSRPDYELDYYRRLMKQF